MYLTYVADNKDNEELFTFAIDASDASIFTVHSVSKVKLESDPLEDHNVVCLQVYGNKDEYIGFTETSGKIQVKSFPEAIVLSKFSPVREEYN